jgi:hypothetical protein
VILGVRTKVIHGELIKVIRAALIKVIRDRRIKVIRGGQIKATHAALIKITRVVRISIILAREMNILADHSSVHQVLDRTDHIQEQRISLTDLHKEIFINQVLQLFQDRNRNRQVF